MTIHQTSAKPAWSLRAAEKRCTTSTAHRTPSLSENAAIKASSIVVTAL
ncbi:MAG: hypothetical protein KGQ52_09670 [Alphaproteobacteria bacterium]|nr:hypothetical protein [Alphaproteobacteria bacterium]